jgi:hypothetical protein
MIDELAQRRARRHPAPARATLRRLPDGSIELDDPSLDSVLVWPRSAARDMARQILRLTR